MTLIIQALHGKKSSERGLIAESRSSGRCTCSVGHDMIKKLDKIHNHFEINKHDAEKTYQKEMILDHSFIKRGRIVLAK